MTMRMWITSLAAAALLMACGSKDNKKKDEAGSKKPAAAETQSAAPGAWKDMQFGSLGVVARVPGDATKSKMGGISAMNHKCTAMIRKTSKMAPSFENLVKNVEKGHRGGPVEQMIRKEKTDDVNFVVEYSTKTKRWAYDSRRKVGENVISCGRVSTSKEGHDCVVKVCESLKPI